MGFCFVVVGFAVGVRMNGGMPSIIGMACTEAPPPVVAQRGSLLNVAGLFGWRGLVVGFGRACV